MISLQSSLTVISLLLTFLATAVAGNSTVNQLYSAAAGGSAAAQFKLGQMYEYGRNNVDQDDSKAVKWYRQSAAQNNTSALYRLGVLNDNGWGLPTNKAQALTYYRAAANQGHIFAQHDLGIMYFQGTGIERSLINAYKWLRIAQLNGSELMQKHLRLVASEMNQEQIKLAEFLAKGWKKRTRI